MEIVKKSLKKKELKGKVQLNTIFRYDTTLVIVQSIFYNNGMCVTPVKKH